MKPKGVTIQMKALDEYIIMVLFVFILKNCLAIFGEHSSKIVPFQALEF